jgi:limonene-1,2-epoxide hydrolase
MSSENEQLVSDFCEAWSRRDIDEIVGYFTPDAVYHNIPMDPVTGLEAIRNVLTLFVPTSTEIEWTVHAIGSNGDLVFTERTDRFVMGEKSVDLPVAGVFEISDGKIKAWRDYFDLNTWTSSFA